MDTMTKNSPKVWLMFPDTERTADYMTRMVWFGARRCRAYKDYAGLALEVWSTPMEVLGKKLWAAVHEDWALDLLRHTQFTFDVENVPKWLWEEMWRHSFIVRNVAIEERSQRAVKSWEIPVYNPFQGDDAETFDGLIRTVSGFMQEMERKGYSRDDVRNASFQGAMHPAMLTMNAETIHHLVKMRGSKGIVGEFGGKAAPLFQMVADDMWTQAKNIAPWLFQEVLK